MDLVFLISVLENFFAQYGLWAVLVASFIEMSPFGWAIPGGTVVAVASFFAFSDTLSLVSILSLGWFGSWVTFLLSYLLGKQTGYKLVKRFKQEKAAARAKTMLKRHGGVILTTSMLAGLTRFWVAYVAGAQKYDLVRFVFYSATASLTWTSLQVAVGYLAGSQRANLEQGIRNLGIVAWILLLVALGIIFWANKQEYEELEEENK